MIKSVNKRAFTMLELVFVIVIMGIIGKFGTEFIAQAYKSFIYTKVNNQLQSDSLAAVEFVSKRLQYRIKDSTIAREDDNTSTSLSDYSAGTANIIEWIGADVEGFRGDTGFYWSGVIDLTASDATKLVSPGTTTNNITPLIQTLSGDNTKSIDDAALYFVGSQVLSANPWGWSGAINDQVTDAMHPIKDNPFNLSHLLPNTVPTFSGTDAYEFYQLAWTAYAVGIDDWNAVTKSGTLKLWYAYQPWNGETRFDGKTSVIMENVSSFRFIAQSSLVKIQVCVKSDIIDGDNNGGYSLCKEKTVF
ncbi:MAG: type II secretion system protein [Sulfurimonas sp.]